MSEEHEPKQPHLDGPRLLASEKSERFQGKGYAEQLEVVRFEYPVGNDTAWGGQHLAPSLDQRRFHWLFQD